MTLSLYLLIFAVLVATTVSEKDSNRKALIISVDETKPQETKVVVENLDIAEQSQSPSYEIQDRAPYTPQSARRVPNSLEKQLGYILVSPDDLKRLRALENVSVEKPRYVVYGETVSPDSYESDDSRYIQDLDKNGLNKYVHGSGDYYSNPTRDHKYPSRPAPPLHTLPRHEKEPSTLRGNTGYRSAQVGVGQPRKSPSLTPYSESDSRGPSGKQRKSPVSGRYSSNPDADGPYLYAIFKTQKPLPFGPKYYSVPLTSGKYIPHRDRPVSSNPPSKSYDKSSTYSKLHPDTPSYYDGPSKPSSYTPPSSYSDPSKPSSYDGPSSYSNPPSHSYDTSSYSKPTKTTYDYPSTYHAPSKSLSYDSQHKAPIKSSEYNSYSGSPSPNTYESSKYSGSSKPSSYNSPTKYSDAGNQDKYYAPPSHSSDYQGPSKQLSYKPTYSHPPHSHSYENPSSYSGPSYPSSYENPSSYSEPSHPSSYESSYDGPPPPNSYSPSSYSDSPEPSSYESPSHTGHSNSDSYEPPSYLPSKYDRDPSYRGPSKPNVYESKSKRNPTKYVTYDSPSPNVESPRSKSYDSKSYGRPIKGSPANPSSGYPHRGTSKPNSYTTSSGVPYGSRHKPNTYKSESYEKSSPKTHSGPTSSSISSHPEKYRGTVYRDQEHNYDSQQPPSHYEDTYVSKHPSSGYSKQSPSKQYDGPTSYFTADDAVKTDDEEYPSDKNTHHHYLHDSGEDYHSAKKNYNPMRPAPLEDDYKGHGHYPPLPAGKDIKSGYSDDEEDNGKERDEVNDDYHKSHQSYGNYYPSKSHSTTNSAPQNHAQDYQPGNAHAYHPNSGENHSYYHPDHSSEEIDHEEPKYHITTTTTTISKPKFESSGDYGTEGDYASKSSYGPSKSTYTPSISSTKSSSYSSGSKTYQPDSYTQQVVPVHPKPYSPEKGKRFRYYTEGAYNEPVVPRSPSSHQVDTLPPKRVEGVVYRTRKPRVEYIRPLKTNRYIRYKNYNPEGSAAVDHEVYENPPALAQTEASSKVTQTVPSNENFDGKKKRIVPNSFEGNSEDEDLSLSAIPGDPDKDYPILKSIPHTKFSCLDRTPGFYADVENRCQVYYQCGENGRMQSFLCPNGTIFNQATFVCEWWHNVDCASSEKFFNKNHELYKTPDHKIPQSDNAPVITSIHKLRYEPVDHRDSSAHQASNSDKPSRNHGHYR